MYGSGSRSYFVSHRHQLNYICLSVHFKHVLPDTTRPSLARLDFVCGKSMQLK